MYKKPLVFLSLIASLLFLASCNEDLSTTKNLYTDWWPVHASGSFESELFTATWNGDLDKHGNIEITYQHKVRPVLNYTATKNYQALSFSKSREKFCYINLNDLYTASRYLNFYVENQMIYFEKLSGSGRGSGEYEEGQPISFQSKDILKIGGVTYQRFAYYKETHPSQFSSSVLQDGDRIPIHYE